MSRSQQIRRSQQPSHSNVHFTCICFHAQHVFKVMTLITHAFRDLQVPPPFPFLVSVGSGGPAEDHAGPNFPPDWF